MSLDPPLKDPGCEWGGMTGAGCLWVPLGGVESYKGEIVKGGERL